ncbi:hypothetical protein CEE45_06540 [Candidatus Heimdallarchaeota archaeon B3_Heim]|nr:MAG: hypothetical protein CEE45_06540 [Candidatus Heimdallarchaeota archaeon B3_Heim]
MAKNLNPSILVESIQIESVGRSCMSSKSPIDKVLSPITIVSTVILREGKSIPQKYRNMIAIGLYGFASALLVSLVLVYLNTWYLQGTLGVDKTIAGTIFSYSAAAGSIGLLLAVVVGGAFSDDYRSKYGARAPFMLTGTLITGGVLFLVPLFVSIFPESFYIILFPLLFFIIDAGIGLGSSPTNALLSELFTREQRGWVGLVIAGFTTIGSFVGLVGLGLIASREHATIIFPFAGIVICLIGVIIFFLVEKVNPPFDPIDSTMDDIKNTPKYLLSFGGQDFGKMLIVQSFWGFSVAAVSIYSIIHLTTPAAEAALGKGNEVMVLVITGIVAALMAIPAGLVIKKLGKVNTALLGSIIYAFYCFLFAFIEIGDYYSLLLVIAAVGGIGAIFIESVRISLPADLVPEGKEAQFMGLNKFATKWTQPIVTTLGAQILVVFADQYPTMIIFNLAGVSALLASVFLFLINYEKMLKDEYQNFYKRYVRTRGLIGGHIGEFTNGILSKFS